MVDLSLGIHTWFMVIPFGIFLPLGIVVSRWRSSDQGPKTIRQKWLDIHVLLNITSSVCIFFSFVIGYFNLGTQTYKVHRNLGIFSACLVIIQPLNGWFRAKKKQIGTFLIVHSSGIRNGGLGKNSIIHPEDV